MDPSNLSEAEVILGQLQRRVQQCSRGQANTTEADAEAADKHHQERSRMRQGTLGMSSYVPILTGGNKVESSCPPDVHGARTGQQAAAQAVKPQWVRGILAALQEAKDAATAADVATADQWQQGSQGNSVGKKVLQDGSAAHWLDAEASVRSVGSRKAAIDDAIEEVEESSDDSMPPIQQRTDVDWFQAWTASSRRSQKEDLVGRGCSEYSARPLHTAFLVAINTECLRMPGAADNGKNQHRNKKDFSKT